MDDGDAAPGFGERQQRVGRLAFHARLRLDAGEAAGRIEHVAGGEARIGQQQGMPASCRMSIVSARSTFNDGAQAARTWKGGKARWAKRGSSSRTLLTTLTDT